MRLNWVLLLGILFGVIFWAFAVKCFASDYVNFADQGTVEYTSSYKNYALNKVTIPDGSVVSEANFYQKSPHTIAITGKDLTFIMCNLVNVEVDPSWTLKQCNNAQIERVIVSTKNLDGSKELTISSQVEVKGKFVEVEVVKETYGNGTDYDNAVLLCK